MISSIRLRSLLLHGLWILLCRHIPATTSASVESEPRQLQPITNVSNTSGDVTINGDTNTTTTSTETELSQPDCLAVGNVFVCEINLLLEEGLSDGTSADAVVIDAALTCPLNTATDAVSTSLNFTWDDLDPRLCGCMAALSYPNNSDQASKECPCRYCPIVSQAGTGSTSRAPISIDCSSVTDNPFVQGTCRHVGCDGSCLDIDSSTAAPASDNSTAATASENNTTTPPTEPPETQTPTPGDTTTTEPPEGTDNNSTTSEPTPTLRPRPISNGTCIMDFPFCPENRQVPKANLDILIDPILDRTCGSLHENRNDPQDPMVNVDCDTLVRSGLLCCTEDIVTESNTTAPLATSPPTKPGTQIVTIPSLFRIYNLYNLTAAPLMEGPEWETMQKSYADFVKLVVLEKLLLDGDTTSNATSDDTTISSNNSSTTSTRYLRHRQILFTEDELQQQKEGEATMSAAVNSHPRRRRRLQVVLDTSSIQVYSFNDTDCPTTIPFEAKCQSVNASYNLFVYEDINSNSTIYQDYTNFTQEAIDRGLLNETMDVVDPYTVMIVDGSLPIDVTDDSQAEEPDNNAQGPGYKEYWMVGLGVSITIVVCCLVAILCASDWSGHDKDDDSVDPWEKESKADLISKAGSRAGSSHKEKAPRSKRGRRDDDDDDDKSNKQTERQEYEMYRVQVEELIEQKTPEEMDNIDELMDLFYKRELILIATLKNMPDAYDGIVGESINTGRDNDSSSSSEEIEQMKKKGNMSSTTQERFEDSMFWNSEDGSSGEFAEESAPTLNLDSDSDDDDDEKKKTDKFHRTSTHPIEEGDEDAELTDIEEEPEPAAKKAAAQVVEEEESDEEDEVDASETEKDKTSLPESAESEGDDGREESGQPTPDAQQADSAEAGGEASDDDSGNAAGETWDDEDAQEKEQSEKTDADDDEDDDELD